MQNRPLNRWLTRLAVCLMAFVLAGTSAQVAPEFAGHFRNDRMTVELVPAKDGTYTGTIRFNENLFPLEARPDGSKLQGAFRSQGHSYTFTASLEGNELRLSTGGVTHSLQRQESAPPNPLAAPEPAEPRNPLAVDSPPAVKAGGGGPDQPQATTAALPGYDVLAAEPSGQALFVQKPGVRSAKEGVLATLRDLARVFDAKPTISGALGDDNDKQCQCGFNAKAKGQAVKGTVLCGVGENGAAITTVYARADAPTNEVARLMGALPMATQWQAHPLSGGSGTINLPPDWKITQSTPLGSVMIDGPAEQKIGLGVGAEVVDPRSFIANQVRAAGTMLVAPFTDPVTALKNLVPQLSAMSQRNGGPAVTLNRIITNSPAQAQIPGGQAAWITSDVTRGTGQKAVHLREVARLECYQLGPMGWGLYTSYVSGPEATFDRDLPLMLQIANSWKLNDQAVMSNSRQMIDAQNRSFAAFQQSMKERNQAFDSYMESLRNSERVRDRSNADFVEIIRGYRTVEDTQTGYRNDVDLGYSKEIVDKLNEKEGYNRYKEIPLRDQ